MRKTHCTKCGSELTLIEIPNGYNSITGNIKHSVVLYCPNFWCRNKGGFEVAAILIIFITAMFSPLFFMSIGEKEKNLNGKPKPEQNHEHRIREDEPEFYSEMWRGKHPSNTTSGW